VLAGDLSLAGPQAHRPDAAFAESA
jgi:hypothetical protein